MLCRHCQAKKANRPRGLCWRCFYTPGIRAMYPSTSKYAPKLDDDAKYVSEGPPEEPAACLPGTPEKVAVLEQRARDGRDLWHPLDGQGLR